MLIYYVYSSILFSILSTMTHRELISYILSCLGYPQSINKQWVEQTKRKGSTAKWKKMAAEPLMVCFYAMLMFLSCLGCAVCYAVGIILSSCLA